MPLEDLLTIAVLTPAQAAYVAAELLESAGALGALTAHVRAAVSEEGTVEVTPTHPPAPAASLAALLDAVVHSARRIPAHPQPYQVWLLRHLEDQLGAIGQPAERAAALREALTEALGDDAVTRIHGELAALLTAYAAVAVSRHGTALRVNGETPASAAAVPVQSLWSHPSPPRRRDRRRRRTRKRRILTAVVVLALVLAGGGYLLLRGPGSGVLDFLRGDNAPSTTVKQPPPSTQRAHHHRKHAARHAGHQPGHQPGRARPGLAPLSAGPVRGVTLEGADGCRAGTTCAVRVSVALAPATASQVVAWRVGAIRGCSHRVTWSPTTTVTAQPGWTRVFAPSSVAVPTAPSLSLVALTSAPAHAQSRPVPVAGAAPHC